MNLDSSISQVKGVGAKSEQLFQKLGVYTVGDILLHFPRDYKKMPEIKKLSEIAIGEQAALQVTIKRSPVTRKARAMQITILQVDQFEQSFEAVWFRMPYIKNSLQAGTDVVLYGKLVKKGLGFGMEQPQVFSLAQYRGMQNQLQPIYSLTAGLTNHFFSKTLRTIFSQSDFLIRDHLPMELKEKHKFYSYLQAIRTLHFPDNMEELTEARRRIVFDEFLIFLLSMEFLKEKGQRKRNFFPLQNDGYIENLLQRLPFDLTDGQKESLQDIVANMSGEFAMQRLLQGDVGSGKTIIAFLSMALVSHNGYQAAIMAPTEVLAKQHYETFQEYLKLFDLDIPLVFLSGSMTKKQKEEAYQRMEAEPQAFIIGTHALFQEKANYSNLALVITDEQHRFGVKQRESLANKGGCEPHILVMSATPIPRTLALILYGDLDISVIKELPKQRLPIKNCVVNTAYRKKAYEFIENQVSSGHQAYVICPLVEDSEEIEAENVMDYTERLQQNLSKKIRVAYLHGKMKAAEKNEIMDAFLHNEIQVLVSTTVIEVGVNVPNATVMMIENAERFGLAQLHQLRGRVGRGSAQSYCIFVNGNDKNPKNKRLEILNKSNDGFYIASQDLKLRGPGDFLGIRQSGVLDFKMADVYQDADLLQLASKESNELLEKDPDLLEDSHVLLRQKVDCYLKLQMERLNL